MIFYRAVDAEGKAHWLTVQSEAKAIDKDFTEHDIGNQKPDLKEILNECEDRIHEFRTRQKAMQAIIDGATPVEEVVSSGEAEQPEPRPAVSPQPSLDPTSVTDWLLNTATQAQVEATFAAIGCRWGEARSA